MNGYMLYLLFVSGAVCFLRVWQIVKAVADIDRGIDQSLTRQQTALRRSKTQYAILHIGSCFAPCQTTYSTQETGQQQKNQQVVSMLQLPSCSISLMCLAKPESLN